MSSDVVQYKTHDRVAMFILNRPDQMNAFNQAMRLALYRNIKRAEQSAEIRAVVLMGSGASFSAGTDLAEAASLNPEELDRVIGEEYSLPLKAIRQSEKPYICAIHGIAAGIATAFALSCDLVVMAEDAFMYQPYADIGLVPDGGLTWHFARLFGHRKAFELFVSSEKMSARTCLSLDLVNRVVPVDRTEAEALEWATDLAKGSALAQALTKKALHRADEMMLDAAMTFEIECQKKAVVTPYFKSAAAAFLNRRRVR